MAWQPTFPRRYLADLSTELRYRLNDWHDLSSVADAGGINASATTITVPAGEELQFKVDGEGLIEVASTSPALPETMRVRAINETLHTISVARGWLGSTAVAHAQNAQIKIFDEFADLVLRDCLNKAIETLWPDWYRVVQVTAGPTQEAVREYTLIGAWIGLIEMENDEGNYTPVRGVHLLRDDPWMGDPAAFVQEQILCFHYDPPAGRNLRYWRAEAVRGSLTKADDELSPAEIDPRVVEYVILRAAHIAWQRKVTQRGRFTRLSASAADRIADTDTAMRLAYSFLNEALMVKPTLSPLAMSGYMGFPRGRF